MSVRLALRMLDSAQAGAPLTQLAAQARLIAALNVQLTQAAAAAQFTAAQALSAGVVGGAAVTVQAPIPQAAPAAQAGPGPLPKPRPYLWVVDDDEFMRKLLTRILGAANYDVAAFASGAAAIDASAERLPQLILMDVMMPDINGIELTRQLRSLKSYVNIPIVMLTGQSEKKTIVGSKTAGATDFIVKPVDREILLAKVARYLNT
jgi:CheY-like chemotaxis protein